MTLVLRRENTVYHKILENTFFKRKEKNNNNKKYCHCIATHIAQYTSRSVVCSFSFAFLVYVN